MRASENIEMVEKEVIEIIKQADNEKKTELDLSNNGLTTLNPEFMSLRLPALSPETDEFGQRMLIPRTLWKLKNLTQLSLSENELTSLPAEIGYLTNLTVLYLYDNQLDSLPGEIGKLTNLKKLYLNNNNLTSLPAEIGKLSNLTSLYLSNNNLTYLPTEIQELTNLKELDLLNNPLPIPIEILEKRDASTIINYYLQLKSSDRRALNEAKLLVVGQAGVGKTSLARQLVENQFDPYEKKTEGIDIVQWQVTTNARDVRLNVWDFGGQEIMHSTHQFFLTKRSLYLLVLDSRLEEEENRLEYWLKIIQIFGGESPIVIVSNKIDQHLPDLNRRGLQRKYKTIKAFVETSCQTGEGIEELKRVVAREVGALPHVRDELPNSWFAVKEQLEKMKENYITFQQYARLCEAEKISDDISQRTLLKFLHDLGIILNFRDDPRLQETNILNPKWVTKGVYKILNSNELFQNKGVLERDMLDRILDSRDYPKDKGLLIIDMMCRFELCFEFEGLRNKRFLVPDLLAKEELYTGEWEDTLAFEYHYNVLPSSIISRFIVRMHHDVYRNTLWRSGLVLSQRENKALVKADRQAQKIYVHVSGPEQTRRELLAIIRSQFDSIHKTIPCIDAKAKVPLNSHPSIVVDYEHLLNLEALGITSFIPEGLKESVGVRQLLEGVGLKDERGAHIRGETWETCEYDVALCCDSSDRRFVKDIGEKLKESGIRPWLGEWQLRPGLHWHDELEKYIDKVKSVAVFIGSHGIGPWQEQEQNAFMIRMVEAGKPVIPVILPGVVQEPYIPLFLQRFTRVDFRCVEPDPTQALVWGITGERRIST